MANNEDQEEKKNIVLINGTGNIKYGFQEEEKPRGIVQTITGKATEYGPMLGVESKEYFIGKEVNEKLGILKVNYPIKRGIIFSGDEIGLIWDDIFKNDLKINPEEHKIIITEHPLNPKSNRELMAEILFETFNIPALSIVFPEILSLYAAGETTGLVCHSGEGVSSFVPIFDGYAIKKAIVKMDIAGRDVTLNLINLLREKNIKFPNNSQYEIAKNIKEKMCYIDNGDDNNNMSEINNANAFDVISNKNFILPDGTNITLNEEKINAAECLFDPLLIDRFSIFGLQNLLAQSISKIDVNNKTKIVGNILLTGGNTLLIGFGKRLEKEVKKLIHEPLSSLVKINDNQDKLNLSWIGGSIMTSINLFNTMWVTNSDYNETGPSSIHKNNI